MLIDTIKNSLALKEKHGLLRARINMPNNCINFSSNDYLSLSENTTIKNYYAKGIQKYGVGNHGSLVVSGYNEAHYNLEEAFKKALKIDDCIICPTGYAANLAVTNFLVNLGFHVFIDKKIHASIYDGFANKPIKLTRYLHLSVDNLEQQILKSRCKNPIVMTESVFGMTGTIAPLAEINNVIKDSKGVLIVDEAHAFGLYGLSGLGMSSFLPQKDVPLRIIPCSKGLAGAGAIIVGDKDWISGVLQSARSIIYSTALSPAMAYGLEKTLYYVKNAHDRRQKLFDLIAYFNKLKHHSSFTWSSSETPIQLLQLGCSHESLNWYNKLLLKNIFCVPMRTPTVTKKETGLRIILNFNHTKENIDYLFKCLQEI